MATDPLRDIYTIMDEAGLSTAKLTNTKKPFVIIVNEIRTNLARSLKSYVTKRDAENFNAGVQKGQDAKPSENS